MPYADPEKARAYRRQWKKSPEQRAKAAKRSRERRKLDPEFCERSRATERRWYANNPESAAAKRLRDGPKYFQSRRESQLRILYGIGIEDYKRLLRKQRGRCAICGAKEVRRKGRTNFCVDHCHKTKKVRGLLCNECNVGLGRLGDSLPRLRRAVAYLERAG